MYVYVNLSRVDTQAQLTQSLTQTQSQSQSQIHSQGLSDLTAHNYPFTACLSTKLGGTFVHK